MSINILNCHFPLLVMPKKSKNILSFYYILLYFFYFGASILITFIFFIIYEFLSLFVYKEDLLIYSFSPDPIYPFD